MLLWVRDMTHNIHMFIVYVCVCMHQENVPPPSGNSRAFKRKADDDIPYTPEEQQHVLKKLRLHHTNADGTLTLQSANHTDVKLLPLPTPHVGSHDCSIKTRQRRSMMDGWMDVYAHDRPCS